MTRKQRYLYGLYLRAPPTESEGGLLVLAYFQGRTEPEHPPRIPRTSPRFAVWMAGRAHAKQHRR